MESNSPSLHQTQGDSADPPEPHGPYYQWTRKIAGKTITRRLTEHQAALYSEWITNGRRISVIVTEMEKVSAQAAEILLRQPPPKPST